MALLHVFLDISHVQALDRNELQRGRDEAAAAKKADPERARHVAVGIKVEPSGQPRDRSSGIIHPGKLGTNALAIGFLGFRPVSNSCTPQRLDYQAGRVVRASPNPSGRTPGDTRVFSRKSLGRRAEPIEDHGRRSIQVVTEEAWVLLFLRFGLKV